MYWTLQISMPRITQKKEVLKLVARVLGVTCSASNMKQYSCCCSLWSIGHPWNASTHFSFLILYTVGRTPWTSDQPVARPLPKHRTTQTQNKCRQTLIPRAGFEPTIPVFERAKTFHVLDRAAPVIGYEVCTSLLLLYCRKESRAQQHSPVVL
jgi:hypothetical protein